jgi:phenylpropionate dioxygenase-like ring-hydroxylating dioxygenase large terminal subunit
MKNLEQIIKNKTVKVENAKNVAELLEYETRPIPEMFKPTYQYIGSSEISTDVFTNKKYAQQEYKLMWSKVWQMVCREQDIAQPGSHFIYEIGKESILITRADDGKIRAFHNTCLHRGRKLKVNNGCSKELKCPFHGWTWRLDGELKKIPYDWDFCHVEQDKFNLPKVKVDTWAGFVFINLDENCIALTEYLGPLVEHFDRWKLEQCAKIVHVKKRIPANWKVAMEAFMEAYHSIETHKQIMTFSGDANSQYDIYNDFTSRSIHPMGVQSAYLEKNTVSEQDILNTLVTGSGRVSSDQEIKVPKGGNARQVMAEFSRADFATDDGYDYSHALDCEMLDAFVYNVFPNFSPWGGYVPNIIYRWLPDGADPNSSFMEVMVLKRVKKGEKMPLPCALNFLSDEKKWSDAPELGALGPIFDQDMGNLPYVQAGLNASKTKKIQLGNYQEVKIRHIHNMLDKFMSNWELDDGAN